MDSIHKLILLIFLSFTSSVYSSAQLQVNFKATNFQQLLKTPSGLLTSAKFTARNIGGKSVYALRTVPLTKSIVGNVLKSRAFSPWGIAITAGITAAGYLLDSNTGEVIQEGEIGAYSTIKGRCRITMTPDYDQLNRTAQQCQDTINSHPQADSLTSNGMSWNAQISQFVWVSASTGSIRVTWNPNTQPSIVPDDYFDIADTVINDEEVYDSVVPNFSETQISNALTDPQTGLPDEELTPLVDAAADLTQDYDDANDSDPNTEPTTDNENDTGSETFTEDATQLPNEKLEDSQQPEQDQCELHPDAIGCQEYGEELTSVEIPVEEMTFTFNPVALSSNTSCPAPTVISLTHGDLSFTNQPFCDFLTGINPVVIAVSSLLSLYILTGGVQRG